MHKISDFVISVERLSPTGLIIEVSGILWNPNIWVAQDILPIL